MNTRNISCLLIIALFLSNLTIQKSHKNRKLKGGLTKKKSRKKDEQGIEELDNEKEYLEEEIDFSDPSANIQAVHITLGDYFNNRESPNIYRVGFMMKNPVLQDFVALKILNPRKKKIEKDPNGNLHLHY
jgi:hypothetical protein